MDPENAAIAAEAHAANRAAVEKAARERGARERRGNAWKARKPEPRNVEIVSFGGATLEIVSGWTNGEHACAKLVADLATGEGVRLHCPLSGRLRIYTRGLDREERSPRGWIVSPRVISRDVSREWAPLAAVGPVSAVRPIDPEASGTLHALTARGCVKGTEGAPVCGAEGVRGAVFAYGWFQLPTEEWHDAKECPACAAHVRADRERP